MGKKYLFDCIRKDCRKNSLFGKENWRSRIKMRYSNVKKNNSSKRKLLLHSVSCSSQQVVYLIATFCSELTSIPNRTSLRPPVTTSPDIRYFPRNNFFPVEEKHPSKTVRRNLYNEKPYTSLNQSRSNTISRTILLFNTRMIKYSLLHYQSFAVLIRLCFYLKDINHSNFSGSFVAVQHSILTKITDSST